MLIKMAIFLMINSLIFFHNSSASCQTSSFKNKIIVLSCEMNLSVVGGPYDPYSKLGKAKRAANNPQFMEIMRDEACSKLEDIFIDLNISVVPYPKKKHYNFSEIKQKSGADFFLSAKSNLIINEYKEEVKEIYRLIDLTNGRIICKETFDRARWDNVREFINNCGNKLSQ